MTPNGTRWMCIVIFLSLCVGQSLQVPKNKKPKSSGNTKKQPHIVFVLADDLGFHDIGYHGSKMITPTLDAMATDGVKLENYYVQPTCSPSRCTLLSGRYLIHTGLQHLLIWDDQPNALPRDSPTLPEKLREAGYSTHMVGKWHAGFYKEEYLPHHRGFDTFFGFLNGHSDHYTHKNTYKVTKRDFLDLRFNDIPINNMSGHYSTHMYTKKAQDIIANHDHSKPLFLYLSHQAVHDPLQVPEEYEKPFDGIIEDKRRKTYAGMLLALDEGIKNLTTTLKEHGLWDDTILVFSSDNGGQPRNGGNNWPLRGWKFSLWEGGIRGIAFVTGGKNIELARGTTSTGLMHISDWYPTFISMAGGNLNGVLPLDGVDNGDMFRNQSAPSKRSILLHNIDPLQKKKGVKKYPERFDTRIRSAIRMGDLKLITGNPGRGEWVTPPETPDINQHHPLTANEDKKKNIWLFNIKKDPNERHDLSDMKPKMVQKMLRELEKLNATSVPVNYPPRGDPNANPALHGDVWGPWID